MLKIHQNKKLIIRYSLFTHTKKLNDTLIKICKHFSFVGYKILIPVTSNPQQKHIRQLLSDFSVDSVSINLMIDWGNMGEYLHDKKLSQGSILLSEDPAELFTTKLYGYKAIEVLAHPRNKDDFFLAEYPKMFLSYYKDSTSNARKIKKLIHS